jgi:tetratricopeptide (TPR) repeat protein
MKTVIRQRKAAFGTSRKRRPRPAHPRNHSGRSRSGDGAHARVGTLSPAGANAARQATSPATAALWQPDAVFHTAVKNFELGARAFHKQNYGKAKEIFERLASSRVAGVAERARVHLHLCEQKLSRPVPPPKKPEELYALGVGALNLRRLDDAIQFLNKAQKSAPKLEYISYALAAAYSLRGDAEDALQHLKEAISLRPQNRIQARRDEDFQRLAADARFRELVLNPQL